MFFYRLSLIKNGNMEREVTWQWRCLCWMKHGLYHRIERLWTSKVFLYTQHGVTWATIRTYTSDVESGATVFWIWCSHIDNWSRWHLLPDRPIETGCFRLFNWFPWRVNYYLGVDKPPLHSWDQDIREENSHKSSGGWPTMDSFVYHVESGGKPGV